MRLIRLALALIALLPVSAFFSAQPAMAQANCRWDLDGLWVGQRNGWRVNIKARPDGYVVWADGTPEPGQGIGDYLYRDAGPKLWVFTFPDGTKASMQLDAAGLLQTKQPDGPETFKRIRPATPPKCVGASSVSTGAQPSLGYNAALAAPTRMIRGLNLEDVKAIMGSEGYRIENAKIADGGIQVLGIGPDGYSILALADECTLPAVTNCKRLLFIRAIGNVSGGQGKALRVSLETNLSGIFFAETGTLVAKRYVPIFSGVTMQYLRDHLRSMKDQDPTLLKIAQQPADNSGGM